MIGGIGRAVGGAVKGFARGGPLGAIGGALGGITRTGGGRVSAGPQGILGGGITRHDLQRINQGPRPTRTQVQTRTRGFAVGPVLIGDRTVTRTGGGRQGFAPAGGGAVAPAGGAVAGQQLLCPPGFHPNKSDYFLKSGSFVAAGTKCVRNRRVNPLNPRALVRSGSRLRRAASAARFLAQVKVPKRLR